MADPELHKRLIRRWFEEAISSNDAATICRIADEVFAEDYQDGDAPHAPQNRDEFKRMIVERMLPAFERVEATVEHILAEGALAAAYVRISATHAGEFWGLAATGRRITFHEATISFMEDGRVKYVRGKADWLSVLQQLGLAPTRPAAELGKIRADP